VDRELAGRVALVTGCGNPRGIGMACAMVLGREGAQLSITSTTDRIEQRGAELRSEGHDVETTIADLIDRGEVAAVVEQTLNRFGSIDIVVNNAGMVNVGLSDFEFLDFLDMQPATWDLEIAMNLATAFNVTHAAVPTMVRSGWGRIVMVSSVTGPVVTNPGSTGYGAAKAGMEGMMRGLAFELGPFGVTANAVAPAPHVRATRRRGRRGEYAHPPSRSATGRRRGGGVPFQRPSGLRDRPIHRRRRRQRHTGDEEVGPRRAFRAEAVACIASASPRTVIGSCSPSAATVNGICSRCIGRLVSPPRDPHPAAMSTPLVIPRRSHATLSVRAGTDQDTRSAGSETTPFGSREEMSEQPEDHPQR
jgi:3-oxoacyl-[acyl-carrier protein] reductase